jgi:SAM-dependent methyltransferase
VKGVDLVAAAIAGDLSEYDLALAEGLVPLVAEFFGLNDGDVWRRITQELRAPGSTVANAWNSAKPSSPDDVRRFYSETDSYVYDLIVDHCHVRRRGPWEALMSRIDRLGACKTVLTYGDGIGSDSIKIARSGHKVTYFDVPGVTSAFARFRFQRENLTHRITVIEEECDIPDNTFDAAVCIEVLEHVPDPPAIMRGLHRALKSGGIALITESFESIGDDFPSHLPSNFQYAGRTHKLMEAIGFANTYYNLNPVNRPMEFTKVDAGLPGELVKIQGKLRRAIGSRWRRISQVPGRMWL